jgi:protoheme IX farnesyltransferase
MIEKMKILLDLVKFRITIAVMITTAFGYILAKNSIDAGIILPCLGIFLLACSSAAINQIQEREIDAIMSRTKNRPLPSGKLSLNSAIFITLALFVSGTIILYASGGLWVVLLSILNLVWYNFVYTPLKRVTAFAIIPGSLVGAIPPVVGWIAGGGYGFDSTILLVAAFFFLWQVPHFWLLLFNHSYEYEKAGLPTLTQIFTREQLSHITYILIIGTALTSLMFPLSGIIELSYAALGITLFAILLVAKSSKLMKANIEKYYYRTLFVDINVFVLLVIAIVSLERIFIKI